MMSDEELKIKKAISRNRLLDVGIPEEVLDMRDVITDKYAVCVGWNGVVWHHFNPEIIVSVSCAYEDREVFLKEFFGGTLDG